MNGLLKRYEGLATKLRNKIVTDIFKSARLRITLLYFLVGVLMLSASSAFTYNRIISILNTYTRNLNSAITSSVAQISTEADKAKLPAQAGPQPTPEDAIKNQQSSKIITDTVGAEIEQLIYTNFLWMILVILLSSYLLAGITLKPIERAMENRKRFIANVSHELRTPLSVLKTSSEAALLDEENLNKEKLVGVLKSNIEEIDRISNILKLLLTFSNLEHRPKKLDMWTVNLSEVVDKSVKTLQSQIARKKINLEVWKAREVLVVGNDVALEEVLLNLLKNAIRHTPEEGHIRISIENKINEIVLTVKDSGIGIPANDLPHVFEPFYEGRDKGNKMSARRAGLGLGLSITKEIIALHKGKISIDSKVNRGAIVEVRLPALQ